ncbi:MAG: hypothetical protein ACJZ1Y_05520 [Candidatus Neomarinimicrobiota bacterium]
MLKRINYFIISIIIFEVLSLIIGSGTHFEHYKYGIMLTIISINYVVLYRQSKLRLAKQYQNPIKRS